MKILSSGSSDAKKYLDGIPHHVWLGMPPWVGKYDIVIVECVFSNGNVVGRFCGYYKDAEKALCGIVELVDGKTISVKNEDIRFL
jgi:hypothetical protein